MDIGLQDKEAIYNHFIIKRILKCLFLLPQNLRYDENDSVLEMICAGIVL